MGHETYPGTARQNEPVAMIWLAGPAQFMHFIGKYDYYCQKRAVNEKIICR